MLPNSDLQIFRARDAHDFSDRSGAPIFTGGTVAARPAPLVSDSIARMAGSSAQASVVRFEAGAHTKWHSHAGDQILVITAGLGHIGTEVSDHAAEVGDIIVIPAGVVHYHGASETEPMAHLTALFGDGTTVHDTPLEWPPSKGQA